MRKILFVDDYKPVFPIYREIFEPEYEVHFASDVKEGICLIREYVPELVVLEWNLNNRDEGKEVFIYAKDYYPHIPVFVVTTAVHSLNEIKSFGPDRLFLKPCPDIKKRIIKFLPPS
ncbi:MAG: response regulator [Candidatus Omnitrophica bacterium]|nr:response regulator [Candidatus Omnitrophota bacterium]